MRRTHDMGGQEAGRVTRSDHAWDDYAKRSQAVSTLLRDRSRNMISLDEMRRTTEDLEQTYLKLNYDERVVHSQVQVLLQRGVITIDELGRKMAEIAGRSGEAGHSGEADQ